jgi:CDP-glucose 4,6-dehydratase
MESLGLGAFWRERRVLLTGHTGFKGAWLCLWLEKLGASAATVALEPETSPSLYASLAPWPNSRHRVADIRDFLTLRSHVVAFQPEIVIHMAAQALVRRSYQDPLDTFSSNVMGTANVLEAARACSSVKTVLVVTSDKVYAESIDGAPFVESDRLGGKDPYSASKACTEIVCDSYRASFFREAGVRLATARAGNVIGGGDWSPDRLVPDFIRAIESGEPISLRYPNAIRPWQHVLEPLGAYLLYAQALSEDRDSSTPDTLNFGPHPESFATVSEVAEALAATYSVADAWVPAPGPHPHESATLKLSSVLAQRALGWQPRLSLQQALEWTALWYKAYRDGMDMRAFTLAQIADYEHRMQLTPTNELSHEPA